jgi:hypothetical protein
MVKKIAFWRTVGDSFNFVFEDLGRFFRLCGAWIAIIFVVFVAVLALVGPKALQTATAGAHAHYSVAWGLATFVLLVAVSVSNIAFAVAWHRSVLLGERVEPRQALRFGWREVRFFLYSLAVVLIYIAATAANIAVGILVGIVVASGGKLAGGHLGGWAIAIAVLWVIVVACIAAPFLARLSLGLPAVAVEEPPGVLRRSWHRGWGNGWRLIWGPLICYTPLLMASGFLSTLQTLSAFLIGLVWWASAIGIMLDLGFYVLVVTANFLAIALSVSFLSLSFRQLAQD